MRMSFSGFERSMSTATTSDAEESEDGHGYSGLKKSVSFSDHVDRATFQVCDLTVVL